MNCLPNLRKCQARCCKLLVFVVENINMKYVQYYITHGCKIAQIGKSFQIIVPMKCPQLDNQNKCKVHGTNEQPDLCKEFQEGKTKGHYIPPGCLANDSL